MHGANKQKTNKNHTAEMPTVTNLQDPILDVKLLEYLNIYTIDWNVA